MTKEQRIKAKLESNICLNIFIEKLNIDEFLYYDIAINLLEGAYDNNSVFIIDNNLINLKNYLYKLYEENPDNIYLSINYLVKKFIKVIKIIIF